MEVMRLRSWFILIAVMVGIGCFKVAQSNAIYFKGYALGERMQRMSREEIEVALLRLDAARLSSPGRLSKIAQQERPPLVGWSTLTPLSNSAKDALMRLAKHEASD